MPKVELPVSGMTCTSCERRIARGLDRVPGVVGVKVSARRRRARIRTRGPVPRTVLVEAIRSAGYDVGREDRPWLTRDRKVWRDVGVAVAALAVLALVLQASGATTLAERAGGLASSGSLALIVVLGLAAGLSTCMALVGGLVLAVSARHAATHPELSQRERLRPQIAFNLGRIAGFAVLGAAIGAAGSVFSLSGRIVAVLMIAVSLVMGAVGLRLTQLSPRLSRASMTLPAGLARALRLDRSEKRYSDSRTALMGAGTFLLPCGFTQAVQVYAMSTGSPGRASAIMTLFALGTLPGLLGIGGLTAFARGAFATRFFRFAGVAVITFAAINANGAIGLIAPGLLAPSAAERPQPALPAVAPAVPAAPRGTTGPEGDAPVGDSPIDPATVVSRNVVVDGDTQVLRTTQVANGYDPASAIVLVGVPIRWEIESAALSCAASLYAPDLGIEPMVLEPGTNVLALTLTEPGTYSYTCGMGMFTASITAVNLPDGS